MPSESVTLAAPANGFPPMTTDVNPRIRFYSQGGPMSADSRPAILSGNHFTPRYSRSSAIAPRLDVIGATAYEDAVMLRELTLGEVSQ